MTVKDESLDSDFARSTLYASRLATLLGKYPKPEGITTILLEVGENFGSLLAGEVTLSSWFYNCRLRVPLAPFVRRLLHSVCPSHFQLNPNIGKRIFYCLILWHECFNVDLIILNIQSCFKIRMAPRKTSLYYIYLR